MGATGPALFSDDLAMDIRGEFREMIGEGITPEQATQRLITDYEKDPAAIDLDGDDPVFWLALAATQWSTGRLVPHIKQLALDIIDAGADIRRWEEEVGPKEGAKRRRVIEKLRVQLLSPQPPPRKLRPVYHDRTEWEVGHAVAYRLLSGRRIIFRILHIDEGDKDRTAIADMCEWTPDPAAIPSLPRLRSNQFAGALEQARTPPAPIEYPRGLSAMVITLLTASRNDPAHEDNAVRWVHESDGKLALYANHPREFPADRLEVIATNLRFPPGSNSIVGASYFGGWQVLDTFLANNYNLH